MKMQKSRNIRQRRGMAIVYGTVTLGVVVGFSAFAVEVSRARTAKGELQAAADAAALNAANGLSDNTFVAKAQAAASENTCDGTPIALTAANVTPGNWSSSNVFTANGSPRNAVRVVASRTKAANNAIAFPLANALGFASPDIRASATVALINQADYEWVGTDQVNLNGGNTAFKVTAFDATNTGAAETKTNLKSNGTVTVSGTSTINSNIGYGTNANIDGAANVTGTVTQNSQTLNYPPGSQVANLNGVTPVYSTTYDLTVNSNQTLPGGTYVVKNVNVSNCTITFTGPATIVATGNLNMTNMGFATASNLPANLKIIATQAGTAININNLTRTMYADIYAPGSTFSMSNASGYYGMRGRGVFKTMNVSGVGSSLWYDRSLTANSLSKKAIVVQ